MISLRHTLVVVVSSCFAPVTSFSQAGGPFESCEEAFRAEPDVYESSYCFYLVAQQERLWDEAGERLDRLRSVHPGNYWLTLARGGVEWTRDLDLAESLFREAAAGFEAQGKPGGEVQARRSLRTILFRRGRVDEAGEEVRRAMEVAEKSDDPLVLSQALTLEATHLTDTGRDLGRAYRSLRRAWSVSEEGSYTARRGTLFALANLCFRMGLFEEAADHYGELVRMAREAGDRQAEATAQYGVVNARLEELEELPDAASRAELVGLAREALTTAVAVDNREVQVMLHRTLGNLLGSDAESGAEAAEHHEQCILLGRSIGQPRELGDCLWSMGRFRSATDPAAAKRYIEEALRLARDTGSWSLALASRQRMRLSWKTGTRERAIQESQDALGAIEALRDLQEDGGSSAGVFSAWARDYYWLSGQLFQAVESGAPRSDLDVGFEVIERMRARVLLERLENARSASPSTDLDPLSTRREQVLREIVDVHRRLLDPGLADEDRARALGQLERLETDEEELRARISRSWPSRAATSSFATIPRIASVLGPDEALLSFQVGLWKDLYGDFGGGAWLLAISRKGSRLHRLPDRVSVNRGLPVFVGLFGRRDGSEVKPSTALYRDLLAEALGALPREIDRLILVPDGELHRMPFAALRSGIEAEPMAARYELSVVPSATLWMRWREQAASFRPAEALVLADPVLSKSVAGSAAAERSWALSPDALGTLPYARQEGRAIERRLGPGTRLLVGEQASEAFLKGADLDPYHVLHFAAHAVIDEERPERSAVVLSPGAGDQDGLLQTREIIDLNLASKVVVLSACRSASGRVLRGEGVLGLARAFFEAGARTVVGSLWPLRDDEAALVFERFYRHLAAGESVAAALRRARQDAISEDLPASAWVPLVLMGDGNVVPFPEGRASRRRVPPWLVALAVIVVAWAAYRLSRRASRSG
jgi:tetratricopeptide (TPR) repeat protein